MKALSASCWESPSPEAARPTGDLPSATERFGITRTTACARGKCFARVANRTPARMDSSVVSGPTSGSTCGATSASICGFTPSSTASKSRSSVAS